MTSRSQPTGRALTVMNEMVKAGVAPAVAVAEVTRMGLPGAPLPDHTLTPAVEALSPAARSIYTSWRQVGHSHEKALEEVRASGVDSASSGATPPTVEELDIRRGVAFGRISEAEGRRQLASLRPGQDDKTTGVTEADLDRRLARTFGRPSKEV